jgi:pimeloyl-ACP methyl ester carboxylesterase
VKPHVLFIPPGYLLSLDAGLRSVPAINTLLAEFEAHFDVDINITGESDPQPPLPGERTESIHRALRDGSHLVAFSWHTAEAMVALDGLDNVRSLVSLGFQPTPAMMRTAGMDAAADAYQAGILRRERSYAMVRVLFQGLDDDEVHAMAAQLDRSVDPDRMHAYLEWMNELNPLKDRPQIKAPTLYLTSRLDMGRLEDMFRKVVPHAEVERLQNDFPARLQDAESGIPPARQVIPFVQRHSA